MITVTRRIAIRRGNKGAVQLVPHAEKRVVAAGRVPRVTRLMALAIHLDGVLRRGEFPTQQALADALHISQPRLTQLLNLNHLAPDIVEALLFLPRTEHGRDRINERDLRPIVSMSDWRRQRQAWAQLQVGASS